MIDINSSYEEIAHERNVAIRERNGLQQQCTAAIRQWDRSLCENNALKDQLLKVQTQRDEAMKEIHEAMAMRIKITKDMARMTEERNAAVQEYSLVMSERDQVHKEIEKYQEEQNEMQKRIKTLEGEKSSLSEEVESLKREISAVLFDRDRILKICNDLREKCNNSTANGEATSPISPTSPSRSTNFWGSFSSGVSSSWAQIASKSINGSIKRNHLISAASSSSSMSNFSHNQLKLSSSTRLDDLNQANSEIESLKRQLDRLQNDITEAQQEVDVCKRRRDWAFSERDKIVLERESIRTLCHKLRRERDRAVSDLAEALRDSDDIKRQRNEALKDLKELKEQLEAFAFRCKVQEQDPPQNGQDEQNSQVVNNNSSRDSAIDADLQEYDVLKKSPETKETKAITNNIRSICIEKSVEPLGIQISCDTLGTGGVFVSNVSENSLAAQAGLMIGDQLLEVCGINMRNATYTLAANVLVS